MKSLQGVERLSETRSGLLVGYYPSRPLFFLYTFSESNLVTVTHCLRDYITQAKAVEIKMKNQLVTALREKSLLENEIAEYKTDNDELTEKITLSVEMMQMYKNERDELKAAHDRALIATLGMNHSAESSMSNDTLPRFLSDYSYSEIQDATRCFDSSLNLDERGYWVLYKGLLHHTEVDIKLFDSDSANGRSEYRQEVHSIYFH